MNYKHVVIILTIVLVVLLLQYNKRVTDHEKEVRDITMKKFHELAREGKDFEQQIVNRIRQSI